MIGCLNLFEKQNVNKWLRDIHLKLSALVHIFEYSAQRCASTWFYLGAIQKSYLSPKGGGVSHGRENGLF